MKITVDRTMNPEGCLVFTITVASPTIASFTQSEQRLMRILDKTERSCMDVVTEDKDDNSLHFKIQKGTNDLKREVFDRVMNRMRFNIENEFRPKFRPICQEIYNWIFDHQSGSLKTWMREFDPVRTKYYFDNDQVAANGPEIPQASEHEDEDDEDE